MESFSFPYRFIPGRSAAVEEYSCFMMLRRKELYEAEDSEEEEEGEAEVSTSPPREEFQRALLAAACNGEPPSGVLSFTASTPTAGQGRSSELPVLAHTTYLSFSHAHTHTHSLSPFPTRTHSLFSPTPHHTLSPSLTPSHKAHSSITPTTQVWVVLVSPQAFLLAHKNRRNGRCPNQRRRY